MEHCFGLIEEIRGAKEGRTLALRSDMDALGIQEQTGLSYALEHAGKMHACGHDCHMGMLLGAAKILQEKKEDLQGTVRLIFQPEEELAIGATKMIAEGVMEGVDAIYGIHIWGTLDAPGIDMTPGPRMASCARFRICVKGESAHGSMPHLGVDAITVAAQMISALQLCVSRQNDPLSPLVVTIGKIQGGTRFNVLANQVEMEGTVRSFMEGNEVEERMRRIIQDTANAFGAKADFEFECLTIPVINRSDELNRIAKESVIKLYGEEGLGHLDTMTSSEDFSWFGAEGVPYILGFVGSRNEEKGLIYSNHHEKYDVDEESLIRGAAVTAQFAVDYLNQKGKV